MRASEKEIEPLPTAPPIPPQIITFGATDSKPSESNIVHRFYMSGGSGRIGCQLKGPPYSAKVTFVGIEANSVADLHGIQEEDELFVPGMPVDKMRDYFLAAIAKPRPMIFHVLRSSQTSTSGGTLHRFIIREPGVLGLRLRQQGGITHFSSVDPSSVAEKHGICVNDILCKPFTNGETSGMYDWFLDQAKSNIRPFVFEVFRKKSVTPTPCYTFGDENPFLYRVPEGSAGLEKNKDNDNSNPDDNAAQGSRDSSSSDKSPPPLE